MLTKILCTLQALFKKKKQMSYCVRVEAFCARLCVYLYFLTFINLLDFTFKLIYFSTWLLRILLTVFNLFTPYIYNLPYLLQFNSNNVLHGHLNCLNKHKLNEKNIGQQTYPNITMQSVKPNGYLYKRFIVFPVNMIINKDTKKKIKIIFSSPYKTLKSHHCTLR